MPSRWDATTDSWSRRVFHYPLPTLDSRLTRSEGFSLSAANARLCTIKRHRLACRASCGTRGAGLLSIRAFALGRHKSTGVSLLHPEVSSGLQSSRRWRRRRKGWFCHTTPMVRGAMLLMTCATLFDQDEMRIRCQRHHAEQAKERGGGPVRRLHAMARSDHWRWVSTKCPGEPAAPQRSPRPATAADTTADDTLSAAVPPRCRCIAKHRARGAPPSISRRPPRCSIRTSAASVTTLNPTYGKARRPAVVPQCHARSELDHGGTAVGTGGAVGDPLCSGIVQHRRGTGQSRADHPGPPDLAGPPRWRGLCPASTIFAGWRQSVLPVHLLGLAPLLGSVGPVAGDVKLQDDGVVHDPVNRRGGGHGVGKDALPLREDQV